MESYFYNDHCDCSHCQLGQVLLLQELQPWPGIPEIILGQTDCCVWVQQLQRTQRPAERVEKCTH